MNNLLEKCVQMDLQTSTTKRKKGHKGENITGSYKIQEAAERHDHSHPKGYSILRWMWTEGEMKGKQNFVDFYIQRRLQNTSTELQKQKFKMLEVQRKHLILSLLEEWENFFC